MKTITGVIFLLVITVQLTSCKKNKTKYTISGNIYYNCEKLVAANKTFVLLQQGYGGGIIDSFKTDASGYFSVEYQLRNSAEVILAQRQNIGVGEFGQFKSGRNYDQVQVYGVKTCNVQVRIQAAANNYTNKDTLYITDLRRKTFPFDVAIPGPFTSQSVYNISNYSLTLITLDSSLFVFSQRMNGGPTTTRNVDFRVCDLVDIVAEVK